MSVKSQLVNIFRIDKLYQNHVLHQEVMISDHYLIHFGQNFTIIKVNKDLNQLIISKCTDASLILQCYLLQMHLIFHGIILTIRTCLQADCIDFIVFSGTNKKGFFFFCHMAMVLTRLKIIILKVYITVFVIIMVLAGTKYG